MPDTPRAPKSRRARKTVALGSTIMTSFSKPAQLFTLPVKSCRSKAAAQKIAKWNRTPTNAPASVAVKSVVLLGELLKWKAFPPA